MTNLAVLFKLVQDEGRAPATVGVVLAAGGLSGVLGALTGGWWVPRISLRAGLIGGKGCYAMVIPALALVHGPMAIGVLLAAVSYVGAARPAR
jgi:predicted MFS family arabinose efflux permease